MMIAAFTYHVNESLRHTFDQILQTAPAATTGKMEVIEVTASSPHEGRGVSTAPANSTHYREDGSGRGGGRGVSPAPVTSTHYREGGSGRGGGRGRRDENTDSRTNSTHKRNLSPAQTNSYSQTKFQH